MGKHFVIRDVDAVLHVLLCPADSDLIAELCALSAGLVGNGKRGDDQNGGHSVFAHPIGKFKLLDGLSETAIPKKRRFAFFQRPPHNILLPVEQISIHVRLREIEPG